MSREEEPAEKEIRKNAQNFLKKSSQAMFYEYLWDSREAPRDQGCSRHTLDRVLMFAFGSLDKGTCHGLPDTCGHKATLILVDRQQRTAHAEIRIHFLHAQL